MAAQAVETLALGVVVERRDIEDRWRRHDWRAVSVLPGAPSGARWRLLRRDGPLCVFHAATLTLELYQKETEGYRVNLANTPPVIYVVLRAGEEHGEEDVEPFLLTACPFEAESYAESGDEIVEGVPMPPAVRALVQDFVARHHADEPFKKRKRLPYDPRKRAREAGPLVKDAVWGARSPRARGGADE